MIMTCYRTWKLKFRRRIPGFRIWFSYSQHSCFLIRFLFVLTVHLVVWSSCFLGIDGLYISGIWIVSRALICVSLNYTNSFKTTKVSRPTGFLKSSPAIVISLTQQSYSAIGSSLIKLLRVLLDSRQDSNSAPLMWVTLDSLSNLCIALVITE